MNAVERLMQIGWKKPVYLLCTREEVLSRIAADAPPEKWEELAFFMQRKPKTRFWVNTRISVRLAEGKDLARKRGIWKVEATGDRRALTPFKFAHVGEFIIP